MLAALDVPIDSQLLVFSKISVQAAHIAPARPRAIYFNDQVMVAHVPGTPGIEAIAVDPVRGPVFYALGSRSDGRPAFTASTSCLRCHHGPNTMGVPGPFVGSVIPGPGGAPLGDDTAIITDHTTPFWERWGGWYVTARRGEPRSRANAVASSPNARDALVREVPSNVAALHHFFDPRPYLAPTSDIVALMVLEHQTQGTNLLTRVAWQARLAAAPEAATGRSLDDDLEALVDYLLFTGEAPLPAKVIGRSSFAARLRPRHAALPLSPQLPDPWPAVRGAAARGPARRIQAAEGSPRERDAVAPLSPSHARGADGLAEIVRATVSDLPAGW